MCAGLIHTILPLTKPTFSLDDYTRGSTMSRRSGSISYRPMVQIPHNSQIYRAVAGGGGKLRDSHRIQYLITYIAVIFLVGSGVIALFGSESVNDFLVSTLSSYSMHGGHLLSASTSNPALTPGERLDRTWPEDRCRAEFPLLYPQLEENARYWRRKGGIKKDMLDFNQEHAQAYWGHTRVVIRNRKVYIRSFQEGLETRNSAMVHLLAMAVDSWPTSSKLKNGEDDILPPVDLILSPGDKDTGFGEAGWAVTKPSNGRERGTWLLPDFGFVSWPEAGAGYYEDFLDKALEIEKRHPWSQKHSKMFWRGFPNTYPVRTDLMNRVSLAVDPSRRKWSDIHKTTFHASADDGQMFPLVTLPEHCRHKFLIHTEGNSYSGRSKYLFSCRSTTIVHPMEWTQHFHPALNGNPYSPNQNYVQLRGPHFAGLEEAAIELRKVDAGFSTTKARRFIGYKTPEQVADNAARTLRDRYLSPAATMCYTRAALRYYAKSLDTDSFGPEGVSLIPGEGVAPDISKGKPMHHLKGDIEVGVWRLLGAPNWPPPPAPTPALAPAPEPETTLVDVTRVASSSDSYTSFIPTPSSAGIESTATTPPQQIPSAALPKPETSAVEDFKTATTGH